MSTENTETIEVSRIQLQTLLDENKALKAEFRKLFDTILKLTESIGITVNGELAGNGMRELMPIVLKEVSNLISLLTQSQMPDVLGGKSAREKLETKFGFFKELKPLLDRYNTMKHEHNG